MKKLILFLLLGMFLISGVFAESCQVARPYYGSVNCKEIGRPSDTIWKSDRESWNCEVPHCRITEMDRDDFSCSGLGTTSKLTITKNGGVSRECSNFGGGNLNQKCATEGVYSISIKEGDIISVDFSCNLGGEPEGDPQLGFEYDIIALQMHYDSGENFQPGTEFCQVNSIWNAYRGKQLNNDELLKSISISDSGMNFNSEEGLSTIPSGNLVLEPKQLKVGQGYWFIYEWVTRSELNAKDYQGMKVWCNPLDKSLTELEELTTQGSNCYLIPTQRLSQSIECCSSGECTGTYNEQDIYCTDDFKCGYTKSCDSDYDCSSLSSSCELSNGKYFLTKSTCDKSKLDAYGKGKCVSVKEEVKCCNGQDGGPNVCGSEQYCDYEEGCKGTFRDCPKNSCCLSGGNYKEKTCEVGHCCVAEGSFVGICAADCSALDTEELQNAALEGELSSSKGSSSTGIIILVIFLIIIGGSIGYFIYVKNKKNKNKKLKDKVKKDVEKSSKKCRKCGNILTPKNKFCTKCGKRV